VCDAGSDHFQYLELLLLLCDSLQVGDVSNGQHVAIGLMLKSQFLVRNLDYLLKITANVRWIFNLVNNGFATLGESVYDINKSKWSGRVQLIRFLGPRLVEVISRIRYRCRACDLFYLISVEELLCQQLLGDFSLYVLFML
jgi:hypothetical protein